MKDSKFEQLYSKISKIVDLVEKVPTSKQTEIFNLLYEAVCENIEVQQSYKDEILNLTDGGETLKAFIADKKPVSNIERTTYFVYFMGTLGFELINAQQLAFCYQLCGFDEPGNLNQNIRDASSKKYGYLENIQNKVRVTEKGRDFCEN